MRTLIIALFSLTVAATAHATTHRTFVSSEGADVGSCGPTTPCRTFAYALNQTMEGGEVIIIKSGGYGSTPSGGVVINQSVSIISEPGVFAALAPTTGNYGITIGAPGINVAIKGLTINGRGGSGGIHMTDGASLDLENVTITNFPGTGNKGLYIQAQGRVAVRNSVFRDIAIGIEVGSGANLMVSGTKLTDVGEAGILIRGDSSVAPTVVTANDTLVRCISNLAGYGFDNFAPAGGVGKMYLDRVTATNCSYGIINRPSDSNEQNVISLSSSFVTGHYNYGLYNETNNSFLTSGNNHVANNGIQDVSGTFTTGTILH